MKTSTKYLIGLTLALAFFVGVGQRSSAFAASTQDSSAGSSTCTPPDPTSPGVHVPTGADASTFTYDCQTGMWVSQYYIYDPATDTTSPVTPLVYTYDPSDGLWQFSQWDYDAATGAFISVSQEVAQPPAGAITSGGPSTQDNGSSSSDGGSGDTSGTPDSDSSSNSDGTGDSASANAGNSSSNSNSDGSQTTNNSSDVSINNLLNDIALSGDSGVSDNTIAGGATSGDATNIANIINMIDSEASLAGESPQTFVENLYGDVNGNILIDPAQLASQLQTDSSVDPNSSFDTTVNAQNSGTINNNIDLQSTSGNANVDSNTSAGNATSGNAEALANIINMIDSMINANQSFIGEINIYGNLNGNILIPAQFLQDLLDSNAPSVSVPISDLNTNAINAAFDNNEGINNQVNATSTTGSADVSDNTSAGSATSGNASSNVTLFNLTGDQIIGNNVLLVFVNVLGNWIGLLMNAPAGATAAAYGTGVTTNTTAANQSTTNINSANNDQINNNITEGATSGNAAVTNNTSAGNATSGNADTGANILNIEGTQFDLSGWFGILFINVFGNWDGSLEAAPVAGPTTTSSSTDTNGSSNGGGGITTNGSVFEFIPTNYGDYLSSYITNSGPGSNNLSLVSDKVTESSGPNSTKTSITPTAVAKTSNLGSIEIGGIVVLVGALLFGLERFLSARSTKKQ